MGDFQRYFCRFGLVVLISGMMAWPPGGGNAQQADVVIGVGEITQNDFPDDEFAGRRLSDDILHFMVQELKEGNFKWCGVTVAEWLRRDEVEKERAFGETKYVDKSSIVPVGDILEPDYLIAGHLEFGVTRVSWTVEQRRNPGGEVVDSISGEGQIGQLDQMAQQVARQYLDKICPGPWDVTGGGPRIKVTGKIVRLDEGFILDGVFPGGKAEFMYEPTSRSGGKVVYSAHGSGVTAAGKGTYTIGPSGDGFTLTINQTTDGCVHGVPNSCKTNREVLTLTPIAR